MSRGGHRKEHIEANTSQSKEGDDKPVSLSWLLMGLCTLDHGKKVLRMLGSQKPLNGDVSSWISHDPEAQYNLNKITKNPARKTGHCFLLR